ncbi:MAG: pyruvate, phosphate dikinase, partial [Pseudomonadota bacterium]
MTLPASEKSTANDLQETVFLFNEGFAAWSDDPQARRDHLGGKGAGLAEMAAAGITVPPGCTIIADVCRDFFARDEQLHPAVFPAVMEKIARIERQLNRRLGDATHPLLLSVRSGSKFSMPGMMDTILNLGLNETTVTALAENTKNPRFAWESFRRFVYSYGHVVRGVEKSVLDSAVARCRERYSAQPDSELSPIALQSVVAELRAVIAQRSGHNIPDAPVAQLREATEAVFRSWNTPRAVYYRTMHSIDHSLGTAVTIQAMVFGNLNDRSATGVCFSRDPSTGQRALFGEFLLNAQGEDVVGGTRTPRPVSELAAVLPEAAEELRSTAARLERHYRDVQDIEFTIEDGKLFILQTRTGKRSAAAAIKIAVDMAAEGLIDTPRALQRVTPHQLQQLLVPSFDPAARAAAVDAGQLLMKGLAASPGAAKGIVVLTPDEAVDAASRGEIPILVREETCPDDIHGIVAAAGVVTARGGMTSHAAVVARGIGKPCIAGC